MLKEDRATTLRPIVQAALDRGGVDAVVELICGIIDEFEARITILEKRIIDLESRLNKNSKNSSKPPSSDGLGRTKRTNSLRQKNTGRKAGGQPGHIGQTLHQSESPDTTETLTLNTCPACGGDLTEQPVESVETRQVFDLPDIKMLVTQYLAERKICPHCGVFVSAAFPCGVVAPVQYGPGMQSAMAYLNVRQLIPCARVAETCQDLFGHRPSAGSVVQSVARCAELLAPHVEEIRVTLSQSSLLHADETGVRSIGKTHWIHVASDDTHSHFHYSAQRGSEGIEEGDILNHFTGTLVHDFWGAYDNYGGKHSRCNAHLLRELIAFRETGQNWASQLIDILLETKKQAEQSREKDQPQIKESIRQRLQNNYDKWVKIGLKTHPEKTQSTGKRGRIAQSKETNLLRRLRDKREEVLHFMNDLRVPFDNNQAERDLRMIKVQQKVSGCFRSAEGAKRFCTIMSYVSTIRKQGLNLMSSIKSVFTSKTVLSPS
jgi:transposase